jgi:hypothetical protein
MKYPDYISKKMSPKRSLEVERNAFANPMAFEEGLEPTTLAPSVPHSRQMSKKKRLQRGVLMWS